MGIISLNLLELDGSNGFAINGANERDSSGASVSSAGDINGDGFDDLIIGSFSTNSAGSIYVVFGNSEEFPASLNLSELNGSNGFVLSSILGNRVSSSIGSAGDINGDGIDDLIVGAPYANGGAGLSYVVFGNSEGFAATFNLDELDGSNGFILNGTNTSERFGLDVSGAGDINGDGIDDLIIGAPGNEFVPNDDSSPGSSYVVFGSERGFAASLDVSELNGSNGFVINGVEEDDFFGLSVSGAGDINGDGIDDAIVGAFGIDFAGASYAVFGSEREFPASINVSELNGSNGFVINGLNSNDYLLGTSVSDAGDINGDGIDDLILGALDSYSIYGDGQSYVVFGSNTDFPASRNLDDLDGSNGFVLKPGNWVSGAGDINGDGIDDVIISESYFGPRYVVFGSTEPFSSSLNLSELNGRNGFFLEDTGTDGLFSQGGAVSNAGDVNGDGLDDLIVGVSSADPNGLTGAGISYVVFGSTEFGAGNIDPVAVADTINAIQDRSVTINVLTNDTDVNDDLLLLEDFGDAANGTVSLDDNNTPDDASDDKLIYTPDADFLGDDSFLYTISDNNGGTATAQVNVSVTVAPVFINLSQLNGNNGFVVNGINAFDRLGSSVSSAGDINGDGLDDLIIGALDASPNGTFLAGSSYVLFGSSGEFPASISLRELDGSNGFVLNGIDASDGSGESVSSAGDINGDGLDDLIIGASDARPNGTGTGSSYVVFGSSDEFPASLDLSELDGSNGFVLNGVGLFDYSGRSVSSAGDINGDGLDDLIIGAPGADSNGNSSAGSSYVVFGSSEQFPAILELSELDGSNGFVLNGVNEDDFSGRVSSAGDINGDGLDDLIIGASGADPNGNSSAGSSYVVFGSSEQFPAILELSELDGSNGFVLNGVNEDDFSGRVSSAGDINGDGLDDLIIGASGADPNGNSSAGSSYVVFGSSEQFPAILELSELDGSNGFVLNGVNADDRLAAVSSAGDINGDGLDDLIIGASDADPNGMPYAGSSYVLFGSTDFGRESSDNTPPIAVDENATTNRETSVTIDVLANDTDDDGDTIQLDDFSQPTNGAVSRDENGTPEDLGDDLLIYTPRADFTGTDSFTYSISDSNGGIATATVTVEVTPTQNRIVGTPSDDILLGTSRDDVILSLGGADILAGGRGDDTLNGGGDRDILIGGIGNDVFVLPTDTAAANIFSADLILGFQVNFFDPANPIDRIGLSDGLTLDDLSLNRVGRSTVISIAESDRVLGIVVGVRPERLMGSFVSIESF